MLINNETRHTYLIDVTCAMDRTLLTKENEKVEKHLDLSIELQHLWNTSVQVIPLIFGDLGSISNSIYTYLATLQVAEIGVHHLQKTIVLHTANIIRRHISLPSSS